MPTDERLQAMGMAYEELIANADLLGIENGRPTVAAAGPTWRPRGRAPPCYGELFCYVQTASGADDERVLDFFAYGMLLNVSAALGHVRVKPKNTEAWAASFRRGR